MPSTLYGCISSPPPRIDPYGSAPTITIFGLIAGILFGYLSDILGFRTNSTKNQDNNKEDHNQQKNKNTLAGIFIEKLGIYRKIKLRL